MKPDLDPRQIPRLDRAPVRGPLSTLLALVTGTVVVVLGLTFSLLVLAAAAVIGVLGFGYLWWKTRTLRKHMREQMEYPAQQHEPNTGSMDGNTPDGNIIEGEVIREDRETPR